MTQQLCHLLRVSHCETFDCFILTVVKESADCVPSLSFLVEEALLQAPKIVGRIQLLAVVGLTSCFLAGCQQRQLSAPSGCLELLAAFLLPDPFPTWQLTSSRPVGESLYS